MKSDAPAVETAVAVDAPESPAPTRTFWRRAYDRWMRIAHAIGVVQTRIVMFLFYFLFVLPLGMVLRLVRDPLHFKYPTGGNWVDHAATKHSLETAQRQF